MHRLTALLLLVPAIAVAQPPSYIETEAGQVRPLALSADGDTLYAVNTPDARLEIFDLTGDAPTPVESVPVGLDPVAVAVAPSGRVWVVNHLSDSVSIVDVAASPARVVRTLYVGDEPRDIVFAGPSRRRAFITTAHRGQNTAWPRGEYATEGIGRADVWVFDEGALGAPTGTPLTILRLFGDVPRALAVSPDGATVYAAVFLSGNRTTAISEGVVCDGGPAVPACTIEGTVYPGGLPAPIQNHEGARGPEVGLIVQHRDGAWRDELDRDWGAAVRFELPDEDVFEIDAMAATPSMTRSFASVGTVLYGMAVNPATGALYVANTEAMNQIRFEGPGTYVRDTAARPADQPASVRGHLHEARVTVIDDGVVTPRALNPHIDRVASTYGPDVRWRTLAQPTALAVSSDGATLYVAALGSSAIGVLDTAALEAGTVDTSLDRAISLRDPWPGGPTGIALDEARGRLYVLTRFDDAVVTVDLTTRAVHARTRMHSPEPEAIVAGRPILYDALATSSAGEASCGSCHVFGDQDGLAWDLGDPDGDVLTNPNPVGVIGSRISFSPLKGPMTTQSLRGLADHGPMHWRGDRTGGHSGGDPLDEVAAFVAFNVAMDGLLGRDEGLLTDAEMRRFAEFATQIVYPPNPIRQLDNSLRADEQRGRDIYFDRGGIDAITTCNGCHVLDRSQGFFGGDGRTTFEGETQEMKVPHLRNAYQKVGMFGMPSVPFNDDIGDFSPTGPQVRGFGFLHDGTTDTLLRFFHASVFTGFAAESEREDVEAFMMAFDSNLPPVVGQQVTIDESTGDAERTRAQLLVTRALTAMVWADGSTTTECDLVVRGVRGGEMRGWLLESDGSFHSDREADPPMLPVTLLASAEAGAGALTATCVPPGSGARLAWDRDEDGARDGDEIDDGTDPADRALFAIPALDVAPPSPVSDAGVPDLDAGVAVGDAAPGLDGGPIGPTPDSALPDAASADAGETGGGGGGCGCRAAPKSGGAAACLLPFVVFATALRRRRR